MKQRVVFYYLNAFAKSGGIEKFNRSMVKAISDLEDDSFDLNVVSAYDCEIDERYGAKSRFLGFSGKKYLSLLHVLKQVYKTDLLILGHINLGIAGILAKLVRKKTKVVIVCHGIEVWGKLSPMKRLSLKTADRIVAMSNYTRNQIVLNNNLVLRKVTLLHNTLDPFFKIPSELKKPEYLMNRYRLSFNQPLIVTVSRLTQTEKQKGYDKVISCLPEIIKKFPDAVYLLCGRYDDEERCRIEKHIAEHNVQAKVVLTGYVPDEEIGDHYLLADVFVLPSKKEGFGIVFIEALACGAAVIGGNQDGTTDALKCGLYGTLICPDDRKELAENILQVLDLTDRSKKHFRDQFVEEFGFQRFREEVKAIINYN